NGVDFIYENDDQTKEPYIFKNTKGNWVFELTKVDEDDPSIALAGAVFQLQKETSPGSGTYENVDGKIYTTNLSGKINLSADEHGDLEKGVNYKLVETKAPIGYEFDENSPTIVSFTIDHNQTVLKT